MKMKRIKSNDHTLDRLSALPDSLIHEILSFMKMRDVVKTTLLSKRWKYLWTTVPCLEFSVSGGDSVQDRNFVSRAVMRWRGTCLRKFSINFSGGYHPSLTSSLDLWVVFANLRKVEELCITFEYSSSLCYCPPQSLYERSSIRKLLLNSCDLQIRGSVQWVRLNSLELYNCLFSENVINQVFSSSPQLETFISYYNEGFQNLSIRSSSLKKLSICTNSDDDAKPVLTICAPKVEALNISGIPLSKCLLTDVSSLTDVDLDFCSNWDPKVGKPMCQILPALQHVATVGLSDACLTMLGDSRGKYSFPPLLNVKALRIGGGVTRLEELLHLFEVFPMVKMLIIDWECNNPMQVGEQFNAENYIMSDLLHLKTVEITLYSYEASLMLQFIEFLLKHATMIEKIVIETKRYRQLVESEDVFQVARQVLSLQRSFPSVELIL